MMASDGTLFEHPTLTEGYESLYMTTEVWTHFDEIWVQPLYIPVVGWQTGNRTPVMGGSWIFSVGPGQPLLQPVLAGHLRQRAGGHDDGDAASVRDVLDSGYSLHPGPGRTVSLVPGGQRRRGGRFPSRAKAGSTASGRRSSISAARRSNGTRTASSRRRRSTCRSIAPPRVELKRLGITTIAASGPRGSNTFAPPFVENQPRYAAYWRVFLVVIPPPKPSLPATAPNVTVFAPPGGTGLYEQLMADGFPVVADYAQPIKDALAADSTVYAHLRRARLAEAVGPERAARLLRRPDAVSRRSEQGGMRLAGLAERHRDCTSTPARSSGPT